MSKEREAFEAKYANTKWETPILKEAMFEVFMDGACCAAAHYQPLLDAKDAEIAELRDALKKATKLESAERMASHLYREENTTLKAKLESQIPIGNKTCCASCCTLLEQAKRLYADYRDRSVDLGIKCANLEAHIQELEGNSRIIANHNRSIAHDMLEVPRLRNEISTYKALLEQARVGLGYYAVQFSGNDEPNVAQQALAAINAATGSTRIEDSVRSIKSCETSLIGEK